MQYRLVSTIDHGISVALRVALDCTAAGNGATGILASSIYHGETSNYFFGKIVLIKVA